MVSKGWDCRLFIVTLSNDEPLPRCGLHYHHRLPLSVSGYLPGSFRFLATGDVFGIPVLFLIFLLVTVVALIFTKKSNACRNIYYVAAMKMPPSSPVSM